MITMITITVRHLVGEDVHVLRCKAQPTVVFEGDERATTMWLFCETSRGTTKIPLARVVSVETREREVA